MRFSIVQSTENIDTEKFKDPESFITGRILGNVSIVDDDLAAKITQEAKAGRSVYLQAKTVDRQDGTFIIAAVITTSPAESVASMPKPVANNPVEPVSTDQGSGSGSGIGSGSGSGPDTV